MLAQRSSGRSWVVLAAKKRKPFSVTHHHYQKQQIHLENNFMAEPPGTPAQEGAEHFGQRARVYVKIPPAIYSPFTAKVAMVGSRAWHRDRLEKSVARA